MTRQYALSVHGFPDRDLAKAVQARSKAGCEARRHVLRNHNGGRVGGHLNKHLFDGFRPPRRCADADELFGGKTA